MYMVSIKKVFSTTIVNESSYRRLALLLCNGWLGSILVAKLFTTPARASGPSSWVAVEKYLSWSNSSRLRSCRKISLLLLTFGSRLAIRSSLLLVTLAFNTRQPSPRALNRSRASRTTNAWKPLPSIPNWLKPHFVYKFTAAPNCWWGFSLPSQASRTYTYPWASLPATTIAA